MGKWERTKGAEGEREVARVLTKAGFPTTRTARNGISAEDVCHSIPGVHIEVKRVERLDLPRALRQATTQAEKRKLTPWVIHRSNRQPWLVTLHLESLLRLLTDREEGYTLAKEVKSNPEEGGDV